MTRRHGKDTVVTIDGNDISPFTDNTVFTEAVDTHDITGYGLEAHDFIAGLYLNNVTISGNYDDGMTGPAAVIRPIKDAKLPVTFVYQPEGVGSGLPQRSLSVLVQNYVETDPAADKITWTSELQGVSVVDDTPQV